MENNGNTYEKYWYVLSEEGVLSSKRDVHFVTRTAIEDLSVS